MSAAQVLFRAGARRSILHPCSPDAISFPTSLCGLTPPLHPSFLPAMRRNRFLVWTQTSRVGEASNPGPLKASTFRCAVTNPTAIHGKVPELLSLQSHLIFVAETSAVVAVQQQVSVAVRRQGFRSYFSPPVPPLLADDASGSAIRGAASGVAILAHSPSRPAVVPFEPGLLATSRITECFTRVGAMEVRAICVYGLPSCHANAADLNNYLLGEALARVRLSQIPAVVAGDWNCEVMSLPAWKGFEDMGYVEAFALAAAKFGLALPPTCRHSTRNDTALLAPSLAQLLWHASVLQDDCLFDSHSPLLLDFHSPCQLPHVARWSLPKPWTDFAFQHEEVAQAYDEQAPVIANVVHRVSSRDDLQHAFEFWAHTMEDSVGQAICAQSRRDSDHTCQGLPRSHRGRCRPVRTVSRTLPQLPRQGRTGDFMPHSESCSIRVKWRVRQCRRLRSFRGGLQKFLALATPDERLLQQLFQEWSAIHGAKGFGHSFASWVLSWPVVHAYPVDFPSLAWLDSVLQLTEFDTQALAFQDASNRRRRAAFRTQEDASLGHLRQSFQALRGPQRPPFTAVSTTVTQPVQTVSPLTLGEFLLRVPFPQQYREGSEVMVDEHPGLVVAVEGDKVHVAVGQACPQPPAALVQVHNDCTPQELHAGFFQFWDPFWNRDTVEESTSLDCWPAFQAILQRSPPSWPAVTVDMHDLATWRMVLRKSSAKSATGACGFAVSELKCLPDNSLSHLVSLCAKAVQYGFPDVLLAGRVNVLAKVDDPLGYGDGRPICIMPAIYRLWTSVLCTQPLRAWTPLMPAGIMGGLPGRSARDVTYLLQHWIEVSARSNTVLSGFVLDIIKCFNALPRQPVGALLRHLGCPPALADAWIGGLNRMTRSASFCGCISGPRGSTSGCPEGDAVSVAAAIAVCWILCVTLEDFGVCPALYVDNWSWTSDLPELHTVALQETLNITSALRLEVDWRKSFAWARDAESAEWWKQFGPTLLPSPDVFKLLTSAKDLGVAMRYRGPRTLGCLHQRLAEGHARLRRLKHMPLPLASKARIIQSAVWPAVFFGSEGHAVGLRKLAALRTSATKALVGGHHHANPFLAMELLSVQLQDPEVFLLVSALRTLRRALRHHPALGWSIVHIAAAADGSPYRVSGPATALSALLQRNHWTLHPQAFLSGPGNFRLNLQACSGKDIRDAVAFAWSYHVRKLVGHRNGLGRIDVPDAHNTVSVLRGFTPAEQKVLARHLTGSFQTAATKVLWHAVDSSQCPWCGEVETRRHRFVECRAFHDLRKQHPVAVHALAHEFPHWVYSPFAVLPDAVDIVQLVFATRPVPAPPAAEAARLRSEPPAQLLCFTDGTCRHPCHPLARQAAWAVCIDSARTVEVQGDLFWHATKLLPPTFHTRACGLVPGRQTIARAELLAAIQAIQLGALAGHLPVHVVSDSSYVVHVLLRFVANQEGPLLDSACNVDLLRLLKEVWYEGVTVSKIKSHQDPAAAGSFELRWHRLGNACADQACQRALDNDLPVVHEMVDDIVAEQSRQKQLLQLVFRYLLELNTATQVLRSQNEGVSSTASGDPGDHHLSADATPPLEEAFLAWARCRTADGPGAPLPDPSAQAFIVNSWGPAFAWRVWHWSQRLQWFAGPCAPGEGITTLELFCDFVATTHALPPLVLEHHHGPLHLPFDAPEARLHPRSLRAWLHALSTCLRQLERFVSCRLLGGAASRKVTSLAPLGYRQPRSGYLARCVLASPLDTAQLLRQVLVRPSTEPFWRHVSINRLFLWKVPVDLEIRSAELSRWQKVAQRKTR